MADTEGGQGPPIIIIIINKVLIKVTLNKVIAGALYIVIRIVIVIPISPCPVGGRVAQEKRTSASCHKEMNVAKLPPVVAVRSLLPRSRPKYIMQAVVVLYTLPFLILFAFK